MCHFLTIAVPRKSVPEVPEKFRRTIRFDEHTNQSVIRHAPSEWTCFTATSGGCSCDFYRVPFDDSDDSANRVKKYQRKGWSDAKIQRALDCRKEIPRVAPGLREDILELVTDLTSELGEIRLALHWYSGDVETEKFPLLDAGEVSLADFRENSTLLEVESTLGIQANQECRSSQM